MSVHNPKSTTLRILEGESSQSGGCSVVFWRNERAWGAFSPCDIMGTSSRFVLDSLSEKV